jgi:16S rRNA (adenine1518-N6/adenine1519-N6)-dimethyltransferase
LLFTVGRGAFKPPPRVESAVIRLSMLAEPAFGLETDDGPSVDWFRQVVKSAFGQRRKMLRNSLLAGLAGLDRGRLETAADDAGIDLTDRAERIEPEGFVRLARALAPAEAV